MSATDDAFHGWATVAISIAIWTLRPAILPAVAWHTGLLGVHFALLNKVLDLLTAAIFVILLVFGVVLGNGVCLGPFDDTFGINISILARFRLMSIDSAHSPLGALGLLLFLLESL